MPPMSNVMLGMEWMLFQECFCLLNKELLLLFLAFIATAKSFIPGKLLEYSQRVVHGRYQSGDGISGIMFFSEEDDYLLISTFDGLILVRFIDVDG